MRNLILAVLLAASITCGRAVELLSPNPIQTTLAAGGENAALRAIASARMPEPFWQIGGAAKPEDNQRLAEALAQFERNPQDFGPLEKYAKANPTSPWSISVLANLGAIYFEGGFLSRSLDAYEKAWELGKRSDDEAVKPLVDSVLGHLCAMHARIGRSNRLEQLFEETKGRPLVGAATELVAGARQGLGMMKRHPEVAFRCGPLAVDRILRAKDPKLAGKPEITGAPSTPKGTSLAFVASLADQTGLSMQAAFRNPNAPILTPAVMHWKVGHFAALLRKEGDRYLVEDATFKRRMWIRAEVLDAEASGYFLVPAGKLPKGWKSVSKTGAETVWGCGQVNSSDPFATMATDVFAQSAGSCGGMPVYSFHAMLASLNITDKPVYYNPSVGPSMPITLTYNQREATQPTSAYWGPQWSKWNVNWVSWVVDDGAVGASSEAIVCPIGGGAGTYTGFTQITGGAFVSAPQQSSGATLQYSVAGFVPQYVLQYADGSTEKFGQAVNESNFSRRFFLTQISDPQGNSLNINYAIVNGNTQLRIASVTDGFGDTLTFNYTNSNSLELVSAPSKCFTFTTAGGGSRGASITQANGEITSITDAIGMTSSFTYTPGADFINSMTTPYGTTSFSTAVLTGAPDQNQTYNPTDGDIARAISATDPNGETEYLEYRDDTPGIPANETAFPLAPLKVRNQSSPGFPTGQTLNLRNSFYWSKRACEMAPLDYNSAHIFHWLHSADFVSSVGVLESEKAPLESRVWYNYPGQTDASSLPGSGPTLDDGLFNFPSIVARLVDLTNQNGTSATQAKFWQYGYNAIGNISSVTDPIGRQYTTYYNANNIDVAAVTNAVTQDVLVSYSNYTSTHLPQTITDASGHQTTLLYTSTGQVSQITNAKGDITRYTYSPSIVGFLTGVSVQPSGSTQVTVATFAPDPFGRVASSTQIHTDGTSYEVDFTYDNLDRLVDVKYPDNTHEKIEFNRLDPEWGQDRNGRWTQTLYDNLRRPTAIMNPLGQMTVFNWCGCGSLESIVDPAGNYTSFTYDLEGRLTFKTFPSGGGDTFSYEPNSSRIQTRSDRNGQTETFQYAADDSMLHIWHSNCLNSTPDVSFCYDGNFKRLTSYTDGFGQTIYSYYPFANQAPSWPSSLANTNTGAGQVLTESGPRNNANLGNVDLKQYTYDVLGRIANSSVGNITRSFQWDGFGRRSQESNPLGVFAASFATYGGLPQSTTYAASSTATAYPWLNLSYTANNQGFRLSQVANTIPIAGGGTTSSFALNFDPEGNLLSQQAQIQSAAAVNWTYGYDSINQLTRASSSSQQYGYAYDNAWNRTLEQIGASPTQFTYQKTSDGGANFIYGNGGSSMLVWGTLDKPAKVTINGAPATLDAVNNFSGYADVTASATNQFSISATVTDTGGTAHTATNNYSVAVGDGQSSYYYFDDWVGAMAGAWPASDASITPYWDGETRLVRLDIDANTSSFEYDGLGRLVHIVETQNGVQTSEKRFVWMGMERVEECDGNWNVTKQFLPQGVIVGSIQFLYGFDHLGSIRDLIVNGAVDAHYDYDPYGQRTVSGPHANNYDADFSFTGYYVHGASGYLFAPLRVYDPNLGRWISRDPIEEEGGLNLFRYAGNNPTSFVDPNGDFIWFAIGIIALLAATPDIANAPAPGDPTYSSSGMADMLVAQAGGQIGGAALGYGFGKIGQFLARTRCKPTSSPLPANASAPVAPAPVTAAVKLTAKDLGISTTVSARQAAHIPPVVDGRSVLTASPQELLQGLLEGKFTILRSPKQGQVVVDFGTPIGEYWSNGTLVGQTRFGSVMFGKKGAHIVPANPNQY